MLKTVVLLNFFLWKSWSFFSGFRIWTDLRQ